jgi:hypothetical protein
MNRRKYSTGSRQLLKTVFGIRSILCTFSRTMRGGYRPYGQMAARPFKA